MRRPAAASFLMTGRMDGGESFHLMMLLWTRTKETTLIHMLFIMYLPITHVLTLILSVDAMPQTSVSVMT